MKSLWIKKNMKYDGSQLRPLYAYENHRILGPSVISWIGACDVSLDHMVDLEDLIANEEIRGDEMLHFIIEFFDQKLFSAVSLQRLFVSIVADQIRLMSQLKLNAQNFIRHGDDLYYLHKGQKRKLSISIAGQSTVSSMIHFALNVVNSGTPVPTCCLKDFGIQPQLLAKSVMSIFQKEYVSIVEATQKARPLS